MSTTQPTERQKIQYAIEAAERKINEIKSEIEDLEIQGMLLCDDQQWFTEKMETHTRRVKGKRKKEEYQVLVGRINWKENFIDEDTGDVVTINRSRGVRYDGVWHI